MTNTDYNAYPLTDKELIVKKYMENIFTPALHNLLKSANPSEYEKWGGNTCRQTAIFGTKFIEKLLPNYEWVAWDGNFSDIIRGIPKKYNHAWIYGIDKKNSRGLLIDLSRVMQERLFITVKENKYPKNHSEYKDMKQINKEKLNVVLSLEDYEYYTKRKGWDILDQLEKECMLDDFLGYLESETDGI